MSGGFRALREDGRGGLGREGVLEPQPLRRERWQESLISFPILLHLKIGCMWGWVPDEQFQIVSVDPLEGYNNESLSIWASPRGGRKSRVSGLVLVLLP